MDEIPVRGKQSKICLKKENTVSERDKYSSLKDYGKIPLQRFRPSASKKKLALKTRLRLQSPRLYMQWTNMHHTWERSSTDEPITARRRTHPAQTARDSCPGFGTYGCRRRAQARFLLLGRGVVKWCSPSSSVEPSERETPRQRGTVNPLITGSTSDGHQAKCTKALPACTAGCRPASRW